MKADEISLEILEGSYWEHFKHVKELQLVLPLEHPKRKMFEQKLNEYSKELQILKKK